MAQEYGELPLLDPSMMEYGPPVTQMGGGEFFSQELGTILRIRYNTESYGQDRRGNLDIGTMRVANFDDAIAFFDGQVTLSDVQGVGFNAGVGFRWMHWTPFPLEPERISGFSLWADGTSTESGNFFPQIGVSYESLGDVWDFRANSYIPLGHESQTGTFRPTNDVSFQGNNLSVVTVADRNTSFNVGELEIARRLGADREAWAFAGPYVLANENEDSAGYRVGVRGYAYPDLLLQVAVSDDEIFQTNASFSLVWFVGRTRTNFQPTCGLPDRMREPVMRNDYVALAKDRVTGGEPLTNTSGDAFRFVHVNSSAAGGGTGTFENPLNDIGSVQANSLEGDIILLYSDSDFMGQNTLVLRDNQRLLGEGNNEIFQVTSQQFGVFDIPETSPGARAGTRPEIVNAIMSAIQLADANEVANLDITGGTNGIVSPVAGAGNPNLHDLSFTGLTGTGIRFRPMSFTDTDDVDNDGNTTEIFVRGNVTIDDLTFTDMLGVEIDIDSATTQDVTSPTVTLQETILISDVTSTGGAAAGILLQNTHDARTATITNYTNGVSGTAGSGGGSAATGVLRFLGTSANGFKGDVTLTNLDIFNNEGYALDFSNVGTESAITLTTANGLTYDGGAGMAGGMQFNNFNGAFTGNGSTLSNGMLDGVRIGGTSDGTITLNPSVTFDSIDGTVINVGPTAGDNFTGTLVVGGAITNHNTGRLVSIQRISGDASLTFNGAMTDDAGMASQGIFIGNNTAGLILFTGDLTIDTTGTRAIQLLTNGTTDISFNGELDLTSDIANTFDAEDGGVLAVVNPNNSINATDGVGLRIVDVEIDSLGVNFANLDATGGANGVFLMDNTVGPITIGTLGDPVGDSGTIMNTTGDAIVINNSANVTVSSIRIDNNAAVSGVLVNKSTTGTQTVNLNDLEILNGDIGVEVTGNGTGTLNMSVNDTTITGPSATGMSVDNIDAGQFEIFNVMVDGNGAAATAGISITGSNAAFTIDSDTMIQDVAGTAFNVNGGMTGTISMAGDITNTAGRSIAVQNRTGGTVNFTADNTVTDTGTGILVNGNSAGMVNFLGDYTLNTGANTAVTVTGNTGASISLGGLDIDTTTGTGLLASGGGTLSVTGGDNTITTTSGVGLNIQGMTIGAVDFESVNATGGTNGIRLVDNGTGTVAIGDFGAAVGVGGTISGTSDAGIHVQNTNVTFNGVTVQNAGNAAGENAVEIMHTNTATMNANLNRLTVNNATAGRDGVVIDGTGGTGTFNANVQNLAVNVTGDGLVVNDGVTLTAGGTNTITSDTGVGLTLTDITIAGAGANFQSVNVTNGGTNAVVMNNVTGGQVAITGVGATANSGGQLTTTGDAIMLSDVENVDLRNMRIVNSGGQGVNIDHTSGATTTMDVTIDRLNVAAAANEGVHVLADNDANNFALRLISSNITNANVVMDVTGAGHFGLLLDATDITADVGGTDRALDIQFHDGATAADVTIRNGSDLTADDGEALFVDSFDPTLKDIKFLVQDSTFTDVLGTESAVDIRSRGNTLMSLTFQGNTSNAPGAGYDLDIRSSGASARMRLNLGGDDPADMNNGTSILRELAGSDFRVFETTDTIVNDTRNNDPVDIDGGNVAGDFLNLAAEPTLPAVP